MPADIPESSPYSYENTPCHLRDGLIVAAAQKDLLFAQEAPPRNPSSRLAR
jgi:hypothetical protein